MNREMLFPRVTVRWQGKRARVCAGYSALATLSGCWHNSRPAHIMSSHGVDGHVYRGGQWYDGVLLFCFWLLAGACFGRFTLDLASHRVLATLATLGTYHLTHHLTMSGNVLCKSWEAKYSYFTLQSSEQTGIQLPISDWLPLTLASVHLYRFPPRPQLFPNTSAGARAARQTPGCSSPRFLSLQGPLAYTLHSRALVSGADYPVREPARGPPVGTSGTFPQQRHLARTRCSKVSPLSVSNRRRAAHQF